MSAAPSHQPPKTVEKEKNIPKAIKDFIEKNKSKIRRALISLAGVGVVGHVTSTPDADFLTDTSLSDVAGEVMRHPGSRIGYTQTANIFHTLYEKIGNITNSRIGNLVPGSSEANFMDEVKNISYSLTTGNEDGHEVIQITTTHTNTGKQKVLKLTCQDGLPVTLNGPVASYQEILDVLKDLRTSGSFANLEQDTPWGQMILLLGLMLAGGYYTNKTEKKEDKKHAHGKHDNHGHDDKEGH